MGKFFPTDKCSSDFSVCAGDYICEYQMGCPISTRGNEKQNNKFIQIIQVGKKYLVISVCKDTINILAELIEEELIWKPSTEDFQGSNINESFQEVFNKLKDKIPRK